MPLTETTALESPYRIPAQVDLSHLEFLVSAKQWEAKEHLWLLREDPSYFKNSCQEWKAHMDDWTNQNRYKTWDWDISLAGGIMNAIKTILPWSSILEKIKYLAALKDQYSIQFSTGKHLPEDFKDALFQFSRLMKILALGSLSNFQIKIIASLPMREPLNRAGPQDNWEDRVNVA